jgi:hypothetical protein
MKIQIGLNSSARAARAIGKFDDEEQINEQAHTRANG